MKNHVKVYLKHFNHGIDDFIPCEICTKKSVDIHHINGRGKGKDTIDNLMALCRKHHEMIHNCKISKSDVIYIHNAFLSGQRKVFML